MKIQGLGQTKNYIKQNHEKIKMKNEKSWFYFFLYFILFSCFVFI
jgi:nitrate/nitrite transporter NarK